MTDVKTDLETPNLPADMADWNQEQVANYRANLKFLFENGALPARYLEKDGTISEQSLNKAMAVIAFGKSHHIGASLALSRTMVVNGEITLWGDALTAIIYASGLLEYKEEEYDPVTQTAICRIKRKDMTRPEVRTFSVADAKIAGLWGRNVWAKYPTIMLGAKARNRCIREVFPDVLAGLTITEDALEMQQNTDSTTKYSTILEAPASTVVKKVADTEVEDITPELTYVPVETFKEMIEKAETKEDLVQVFTQNKQNIRSIDSTVVLDMFKKRKEELLNQQ